MFRPRLTHELKCWPSYFQAIVEGLKTWEIRKDDGRNFVVGDWLHLKEWDPKKRQYTGREAIVRVTYLTKLELFLPPEFVGMSIKLLSWYKGGRSESGDRERGDPETPVQEPVSTPPSPAASAIPAQPS